MNAAIILSIQLNSDSALQWQVITHDSQQHTGNLEDFDGWLAQQKQLFSLYLLLPQEVLSFHNVEVPQAVKRNAQQLVPVLVEEQLAQDIDQVQIHYTGKDVEPEQEGVNVAVCDKAWFEQLLEVVKSSKVKLQACVPESICVQAQENSGQENRGQENRGATQKGISAVTLNLPKPLAQDQIQWPTHLSTQNEHGQRFFNQLRQSSWNMVRPEKAKLGDLGWIVMGSLVAAGLYLINLSLAG